MHSRMTEVPQVVTSLAPTNLDNLLSPEYQQKSAKLLAAHRAAPTLVNDFIVAANAVEMAWTSGDLAAAVRKLIEVRDQAKGFEL